MLVYDAASHAFKGELTGIVTAGTFTATSSNQSVFLTAGKYDFVLFNNKFTRASNNLTVNRADAGKALFGRTTQDITDTPKKQTVQFALKHPGALVKVKLTSDIPGSGLKARLESVNANSVPGSATYDAASGTWAAGTAEAMSTNLTFGQSSLAHGSYSTVSNEGSVFLYNTDVRKLKVVFTAGKIYNVELANKTFNFTNALNLELNGSYTLNVNLRFGGHLYLFNDGKIGPFSQSTYGGGSKTPVAVVIDRKKGIGIALNDANGVKEELVTWCERNLYNTQTNTHNTPYLEWALTRRNYITSGYDETWEISHSTGHIGVKAGSTRFRAFKIASEYKPEVSMPSSVKWFLPSYADWKAAFAVLGFGNSGEVKEPNKAYSWYGNIAGKLFTQVGGKTILNKRYMTSTEYKITDYGLVNPTPSYMKWTSNTKGSAGLVRPFVKFPPQ